MECLKTITVLGSGVMGMDIAILCALKGMDVKLWHRSCSATVQLKLFDCLKRYVARDIISAQEKDNVLQHLVLCSEIKTIADSDLVIESVIEDFDQKMHLLNQVSDILPESSIIATNTSSLSINAMRNNLARKVPFAGLHFFNPVLRMELIEIVVASDSDEFIIMRLCEFCASLGKSPVLVKDSPGFIVNRLMSVQINQAIKMLEEGVASVDDIDKAAKLGLLHPLGPLALADLIGLDILQKILTTLHEKTGDEAFKSSPCLDEKIRSGWLGRKSGKGFYAYEQRT